MSFANVESMTIFIRLKLLVLLLRNAMNPLPKYVFEMSNSSAKLLTPQQIDAIMTEIYGKHSGLEVLHKQGKHRFETDLQKLKALPGGTLGHEYAQHMLSNGLDPDFYLDSKFEDHAVDGGKWEYFRVYSLQSHDIWHVLSGYKTDYLGEIGVFSFLFGQVNLALYLLIAANIALHPILGRKRQDSLKAFENLTNGFRMGRAAKSVIGLNWDEYWSRDLTEIRKELGIESFAGRP